MSKQNTKTARLTDYAVYPMKLSERGMVFIFGFFAGFLAVFILFSDIFAAICVAVACGILLQKPAQNLWKERRKRRLLMQFRDFLDSLQGSFSAGKNLTGSLQDTVTDLSGIYGENGMIVQEMRQLRESVRNGERPEDLLLDFAARADLDDIRSFADTVRAGVSVGGDLRKTVANCREILCERIATEQEISAMLSQTKLEFLLLCGLPFAATLMMRLLGNGLVQENTVQSVLVKIVATAIFVCAVLLGRKITDIRV